MKKAVFTLTLLLFVAAVATAQNTQSPAKSNTAVVQWDKTEYDFKTIPQGTPATAVFKFKNTGKIPLVISNVLGSCGCTVPTWPRDPIAPGETAEIKAVYNAANPGPFSKSVTMYANIENGSSSLTIKGSVSETAQSN
jgi:Protein of unknown function (DUF1573)